MLDTSFADIHYLNGWVFLLQSLTRRTFRPDKGCVATPVIRCLGSDCSHSAPQIHRMEIGIKWERLPQQSLSVLQYSLKFVEQHELTLQNFFPCQFEAEPSGTVHFQKLLALSGAWWPL